MIEQLEPPVGASTLGNLIIIESLSEGRLSRRLSQTFSRNFRVRDDREKKTKDTLKRTIVKNRLPQYLLTFDLRNFPPPPLPPTNDVINFVSDEHI